MNDEQITELARAVWNELYCWNGFEVWVESLGLTREEQIFCSIRDRLARELAKTYRGVQEEYKVTVQAKQHREYEDQQAGRVDCFVCGQRADKSTMALIPRRRPFSPPRYRYLHIEHLSANAYGGLYVDADAEHQAYLESL
jgi:hypothetical protein